MKIDHFEVESWMTQYEKDYKYNLAETCVSSMSLDELIAIDGHRQEILEHLLHTKLDYGPIEGSYDLKDGILSLYETGDYTNIALTHGCVNANELVLISLLQSGDHIISMTPTYQQMYSFPQSFGVDVTLYEIHEENNWQIDINVLEGMIKDNTKMICLVSPNNPTGNSLTKAQLLQLNELSKKHNIYILVDEIYRGLGYNEASISDICEMGISTSSLSKVYSFAGLRIGWIKADKELIDIINLRRDYHIISTGGLNDYLASLVLKNKDKIIKRNQLICNENKEFFKKWLAENPLFHCVIPENGTVAFMRYDIDMPSIEFCRNLQKDTGVFLVPGSCFSKEYYLRFGFANKKEDIQKGLAALSLWIKQR